MIFSLESFVPLHTSHIILVVPACIFSLKDWPARFRAAGLRLSVPQLYQLVQLRTYNCTEPLNSFIALPVSCDCNDQSGCVPITVPNSFTGHLRRYRSVWLHTYNCTEKSGCVPITVPNSLIRSLYRLVWWRTCRSILRYCPVVCKALSRRLGKYSVCHYLSW